MKQPTHNAYIKDGMLIIERTKTPRFIAKHTPADSLSHLEVIEWLDPMPVNVSELSKLMQKAGAFLAEYLKVKHPDLEDAHAMSIIHSGTFKIPSNEEIQMIKPGDIIKVNASGERFWASVTQVKEYSFIGRVDNDLINTDKHGLCYGDLFEFKSQHIYQIY